MTRGVIGIVLLALLGYGATRAAPLLLGPSLTLSPTDVDAAGIAHLAGHTKRVTALSVNGAPLPVDEEGMFSRIIVLPPGSVILTLTATDRFGRTITKRESVYVP
jgi:hypothetical protein